MYSCYQTRRALRLHLHHPEWSSEVGDHAAEREEGACGGVRAWGAGGHRGGADHDREGHHHHGCQVGWELLICLCFFLQVSVTNVILRNSEVSVNNYNNYQYNNN